jgi:hypothetical protein
VDNNLFLAFIEEPMVTSAAVVLEVFELVERRACMTYILWM